MIVKVCGLKERENIQALAGANIDWMGFIFFQGSSRYAGAEGLEAWLPAQRACLGNIKRVGVFVNADIAPILHQTSRYELDLLQLHGEESPAYVHELQLGLRADGARPVQLIKAFGLGPAFDFATLEAYHGLCDYFLFDTQQGSRRGGTGKKFDWKLLEQYQGKTPFLLSGGLDLEAVPSIAALRHPRLAGVDINSRFEHAPGHKDVSLVALFTQKVKSCKNLNP